MTRITIESNPPRLSTFHFQLSTNLDRKKARLSKLSLGARGSALETIHRIACARTRHCAPINGKARRGSRCAVEIYGKRGKMLDCRSRGIERSEGAKKKPPAYRRTVFNEDRATIDSGGGGVGQSVGGRRTDRDRNMTNARQQRGAGSLRTDIDRSSRSHPLPETAGVSLSIR